MNTSQEEARVARIQKYKEERRRQLTARTATLFSTNVTDRRGKKAANRSASDDNADHHNTSAELNINTSTSVPIRTTRTSRLRAAAANSADSSSSSRKSSPRKYQKSSSVQSLLEDVKQTVGSNIIDRDKIRSQVTNRKYNKDRKNSSLTCSDKEIGANKTKPKHSIDKNILDNSKLLVSTPKKNCDKTNVALEIKKDNLEKSVDDLENSDIVCKDVDTLECDKGISSSKHVEKPDIFDNIVDKKGDEIVKENVNEYLNQDLVNPLTGLKDNNESNIPSIVEVKSDCDLFKKDNEDNDIVPNSVKTDVGGLLRTVCFRKVERFSELFSSLCSPHETDQLFEDILSEHGIEEESSLRKQEPECSPPCRRVQQLPRTTSTPKRHPAAAEVADNVAPLATGTVTKTRNRRSLEAPSKTENLLPSSRVSSKSTYNFSATKATPQKTALLNSASSNFNERRRSSEISKASGTHLAKKCTDKSISNASPIKQNLKNNVCSKSDTKPKRISPKTKSVRKSLEKTENLGNDKIRPPKNSESPKEKYHYSKKRLNSLENKFPKATDVANAIITDKSSNVQKEPDPKAIGDLDSSENSEKMSTLHEIVRSHANNSRLSQELDDVATFTKQTLDRVNKLSNNLNSNKVNSDISEPRFDNLFISTPEQRNNSHSFNYGLRNEGIVQSRGVNERLKDIDTAAQRLIDFEKQSAIFSDLNNDTSSQNLRVEISSTPFNHTPVSILKRKSIHEDNIVNSTQNHAIASPPVTFSPSVIEPRNCRSANRQRQGILKKRRSLDESQVNRRSCSPEVSFAEDSSSETNKPILKNRRSSLEDIVRNRSPDGQIHGILKRKMSREEENNLEDLSHGSPEPHGILKRKSNSSSSSSTASSHVSIAQAVLLAAAGGAEIVDDDKETVRPILKKKSFSEERPCLNTTSSDTPKPILKKKSIEQDEHDFDLPKKPILKTSKKLSSEDGHTSSFDLSEEDRGSRRPSLLRSRTSDHSGSDCETTVRPILKQRGSSLTRERSQSPRPRLSFCADNDADICVANISSDANDLLAAGPRRVPTRSNDLDDSARSYFPSAVLRRRNLRPKANARSKSLVCNMNDELLSVLNNRRLKVEETCENWNHQSQESLSQEGVVEVAGPKTFPSIAARIKSMEQALAKESQVKERATSSRFKNRDKDRYKTQPVTVEEMRSITSSLEPGQASFQPFSTAGSSFPIRPVESGAAVSTTDPLAGEPERDPFVDLVKTLDSPPYGINFGTKSPTLRNGFTDSTCAKEDDYGEATFLDFENFGSIERRQSTLDEIEQEVNKVRVALDEDSRALEEDERQQAEADNWSLNVSCDSGVYNRASSRDSGPHSGEELGLIESQEIKKNHATNSSSNEWSASSIERGFLTMERERKSTETEPFRAEQEDSDEEDKANHSSFALGLVKSNSVVARASMWQQLQEQAKGTPKGPIRHSRSKAKEGSSVVDQFKTQPIDFPESNTASQPPNEGFSLAQSKSTANVLDRDEDAKLDEDDPAKLSLMEKMKMFNTKLTHKPPMAGLPKAKEERTPRNRLKTMPVLASQVQEAMEQNERLTKSFTHNDVPRNPDFQLKMELFRSASAKNTSLEYLMRQNAKFRSLDLDDEPPSERAERMITPEVRGILKSGSTVVPSKPNTLAKGESSEGLKDEGIDSSSDDESSASSVSSSEKSCSSSDSSEEIPDPKPRRFQRKNNKLKSSKTDSDLTRLQDPYPRKIQLPGANELKERLCQAKNTEAKIPLLGKLGKKPSEENKKEEEDKNARYKRFVKKLDEPIQLGKLRRPAEKVAPPTEASPTPVLKISVLNQEAKNKFFGIENVKKDKNIDDLAAAVRKYISPVGKSISTHAMELPGSGSDGESSGGREVRRINSRVRHRAGGVQRSATHAEMPHKGGTIAERLAALQAAGANDWRARVCRLSPEREDSKAIERAKNMINESLNTSIDEKKKVNLEENELGANILADRRNKLETAAQGWRKRVPQSDASLFTVAGRLERDKVSTPPMTPPPPVAASPAVASPGVPALNKFKSRKQPSSPTNGFVSGPLRSASCAVVNAEAKPKDTNRIDREAFKRSHSVSESISRLDEKEELSGAEKSGCPVRVPRADDETFHAFYAPALQQERTATEQVDVDLDAIDSGSRQLLSSEWARRAKRDRKHASRNPLRALAARTDLREEYSPPPANGPTLRDQLIKEKATANCGLAAEALAALASKEDFANVSLKSATAATPSQGTKSKMLLHVKGRRRVQTRLVEPVHTSVNRGDCFILITTDQVFLYIGFYANVIERNRSTDIALHIHNTKDLGCKNSTGVIKIDEQSKNYNNKYWNQFWSLLGVTEGIEEYKPVETGHADEDEIFESVMVQTNMCYEVLDDELIPIKEYWGQVPKIAMLNQAKVIVFDFGSEMYIWYGKNVPLESRRRSAQLAQELFDEGYNYEDCHINPLNAAIYQGAREDFNAPPKTSKSRPEWAILSKVTQHMETILFKEKFLDWPDYSRVIRVKPQESKTNSTEITPCDAEEMWSNEYQDPDLILEGSHIGRGTHYYDKETMRHYDIKTKSVCKWVIHEYDYQKVENESEIGEFFSGDSYIIRWEYQITATGRELNGKPSKHNVTGRDRCAYFCWQGKDATSNEKGTAALLTVELDREKGPQVRVSQGNEPPAFLNLFQGNLVVHQGKKDNDKSRYRLFVTRGNVSNEAYLLQVPCSVRQLRSRGSLLLVDTEKGSLYIWHGARSLKHTKNVAIELANKLIARNCCYLFGENAANVKITEVKEGEESKEVLDALGVANKQYYNSILSGGKDSGGEGTPRLFHFTDLGGQFEANEVLSPLRHEHLATPFPFDQKELYSASQPALFLVDDGAAVWLWQGWWPRSEDGELEPAEINAGVGAFAARWQAMRAAALRTCDAYWRVSRSGATGADGANGAANVRLVTAGLEPAAFTHLFDTWTERDDAAEANIAHGFKAGEILSGACELSRLTSCDAVLPLAALQRRPLPDHVDPHHLERHLSTPDFLEAFGMTKEEFSVLPAWKQTNLKKDVGLF